jgi:HSP20 family protein
MPSIRYLNQSAPFWDFVASLEDQGTQHPFFTAHSREPDSEGERSDGPRAGPWAWGGRVPQRGRHGHGTHHHHAEHSREGAPATPATEAEKPPGYEDAQATPAGDDAGEGPSNAQENNPREYSHRHGRCGGRRDGWGPRGRGGFGGFGGPFGGFTSPFNMANVAEFVQSQFGDAVNTNTAREGPTQGTSSSGDFKPTVDVFDTDSAFVVHLSLPGAKKEDVGVNWDAEKSELIVGGVIYRPGDEDFLKTLALDERREVGAFERKIRLGSRANPAQVDADGIAARLEDGILRIEVPKLDKDYVEIKKVDIE